MLSHPLPVIALVGFYPANKLIGHRLLSQRVLRFTPRPLHLGDHRGIRPSFEGLYPTVRQIANVLRTRLPLTTHRLATTSHPRDLHALDTPPAFILSQDQTLR